MPHNRRYRRRRRRKSNLSKMVMRNTKKLRGFTPEKKLLDAFLTPINVNTAPFIVDLNGMAEGTGSASRVGRYIKMESFFERAQYCINPTSTSSQSIRHMILVDSQPNNALPTASDIFQTPLVAFLSPINRSNFARFHIVIDKLITLSPNGTQGTVRKYYRRLGQKVSYNAAGGGISAINKNSLLEVYVSDEPILLAGPTVENQCRIKYYDN